MKFRTIKLATFFIASIFISSCSSDDDSSTNVDDNPNVITNKFTFEGQSYELKGASIYDENTSTNEPSDIGFNLYNKSITEINNGNDLDNIATIYFDFSEVDLQETTYSEILDYDVSVNGSFTNGNFTPGTVLLSDDNPDADIYAQNSTVTINDLTDSTVDLTFSFTRNDGKTITGNYNGDYITP